MNSLTEISQALLKRDKFLILSHAHPDGDTLGCAYALCRALQSIGKKAKIACSDPLPDTYDYLPDSVEQQDFEEECIVSVDIAAPDLIGSKYSPFADNIDICIDHHFSNRISAPLIYVDGTAAAACEIVYELIKLIGAEVDQPTALSLYTGIATDTGCFKYSNTTPKTHRIASELMETGFDIEQINYRLFEEASSSRLLMESKLISSIKMSADGRCAIGSITLDDLAFTGAKEDELEGIVGIPKRIKGVEVGILIREQPDGSCRASVRTKSPIDASEICEKFGGGGHNRAAGCTIKADVETSKKMLLKAANEALGKN